MSVGPLAVGVLDSAGGVAPYAAFGHATLVLGGHPLLAVGEM